MNKKLFLVLTFSLLVSGSCSFNHSDSGSLGMSVNFPKNNMKNEHFSLKVVPQDTFLILVRVNGEGIDDKKPISFELTKEKNSRILSAIPVGSKIVKVSAIDSKGKLLAKGESNVNVQAKILNKVEIELKDTDLAQVIEESCFVSFPKGETISDTLQKSLKDAGCTVEIN